MQKDIDNVMETDAILEEQLKYMSQAYELAKKAASKGDVPIGCVIVRNGKVIAKGYNRRNKDKQVLAHAEIMAIKKASKVVGDWRLEDCTMYVTLEPCQMCAGAIVQARIPEVVIGCMNPKAGCAGSVINLLDMAGFNHRVKVVKGVMDFCIMYTLRVIKFPCSRGVSGALYLQSAIAGVMTGLELFFARLPLVSDVDIQVLRDRNL